MASQGPYLPAYADTDGSTSVAWFNPGNALADDGANTIVSGSSGFYTDRLITVNYGFSIPPATIDGIVVEVNDAAQPQGFSVPSLTITFDAGGLNGNQNLQVGAGWLAHGGASTLTADWSVSGKTHDDVNSSQFGVIVIPGMDSFEDYSVLLDAIRVTVYYTETVAQDYAYPDADLAAGGWTPSSGSDLYAMIDEPTTPNDSDYIEGVAV